MMVSFEKASSRSGTKATGASPVGTSQQSDGRLTNEEALLLLLFRTVAEEHRSRVRAILFEAWTNPADGDRARYRARFQEASMDLGHGLGLDAFTSFVARTTCSSERP